MYVGIDWADDHHDAVGVDQSGNVIEKFRFTHTPEGFDDLHKRLSLHAPDPNDVFVALETSNGLLVHDLFNQRYRVYAINPKAVNRYKDRHRSSSTKSDPLDATALAHLLRTDRHLHRELVLLPDDYRLLNALCSDLRDVVGDTTRLTNQVQSCLKQYHQKAIGVFNAIDSAIYVAFLRKYPNPKSLNGLTLGQLENFLKRERYSCPKRIDDIYKHISRPSLTPDPVIAEAAEMRLLRLLDQIDDLRKHRKVYEARIREILNALPETEIVSSLPGAGDRLVPELTAILGPNLKDGPLRFNSADELAALAGCTPVTRQSGRFHQVIFRRACNREMRRTFTDLALCSLNYCPWAKAFYDHHRKQMHSHATIIRSLAIKWIKILFHLWKTGQTYDEQRHVQTLKDRKVIWAANL